MPYANPEQSRTHQRTYKRMMGAGDCQTPRAVKGVRTLSSSSRTLSSSSNPSPKKGPDPFNTANSRVDEMITIAAQTVSNLAARQDLLKAATAIRQQQTVAEAFMVPNIILDDEQKASIAGGEIAGKLDETFDQIANSTGESLESKLAWFQKNSLRVVLAFVVFALIGTVQRLILR